MYLIMFVGEVILCSFAVKASPLGDNNLTYSDKPEVNDLGRRIFRVPSFLRDFTEIDISGLFTQSTERLVVNFVTANKDGSRSPDFNNIACQVRVDFGSSSVIHANKVTINSVVNGEHRPPKAEFDGPKEYFAALEYTIKFKIASAATIDFELQGSPAFHSCKLEHDIDDIEFLTIGGDYDKLESLNFAVAP